jgi:hypothetical protein
MQSSQHTSNSYIIPDVLFLMDYIVKLTQFLFLHKVRLAAVSAKSLLFCEWTNQYISHALLYPQEKNIHGNWKL